MSWVGPPGEELVLRPSRRHWLRLVLTGAVFVAAAYLIRERNPWVGWAGIIFFGAGVVIGCVQLLPGSAFLRLTREGFEVRALFRSTWRPWQGIGLFVVYRVAPVGRGRRMPLDRQVGFVYRSGEVRPRGARAARALTGVDAALPDCYGLPPQELAALMNAWLARSTARP